MPSGAPRLSTCSATGPACAHAGHVAAAKSAPQRILRREYCVTPDLVKVRVETTKRRRGSGLRVRRKGRLIARKPYEMGRVLVKGSFGVHLALLAMGVVLCGAGRGKRRIGAPVKAWLKKVALFSGTREPSFVTFNHAQGIERCHSVGGDFDGRGVPAIPHWNGLTRQA